jgi:hypothetical protein
MDDGILPGLMPSLQNSILPNSKLQFSKIKNDLEAVSHEFSEFFIRVFFDSAFAAGSGFGAISN